MNLGGLREELAAQHITLSLSESGRLKYAAPGPLPVALVEAMREHKAALLDSIKPAPSVEPLPVHLAELFELAQVRQLPKGAVSLAGGLVTDLSAYVLAWAVCWPRDRAHILSRLEEAHTALQRYL